MIITWHTGCDADLPAEDERVATDSNDKRLGYIFTILGSTAKKMIVLFNKLKQIGTNHG